MSMELVADADEDWLKWMADEDLRDCLREAVRRGVKIEAPMYRPAVVDAADRERIVEAHNELVAGRTGQAEALLRDVINIWNAWGGQCA